MTNAANTDREGSIAVQWDCTISFATIGVRRLQAVRKHPAGVSGCNGPVTRGPARWMRDPPTRALIVGFFAASNEQILAQFGRLP
jgi:hypothetical protein